MGLTATGTDGVAVERRAVPWPSPVEIEWIRDARALEALAREWRALEGAVPDRTVLSTFDYLDVWYREYAGAYGGEPLVGIARRGDALVGVAPLVMRRGAIGRIPLTRVHFAVHDAHAGELLIDRSCPDLAGQFVASLTKAVEFDLLCFNGIEPDTNSFGSIWQAARALGLRLELAPHEDAVVDLRNGYDGYCRAMSRNFRRTIRRQRERVAAAGRPHVSGVRRASGTAGLEESIARLIAVNEASYKLRGQRLADNHRNFLGDLARRFGPRGMLHLSILSIDDADAAVVMGLVERGCYYDVTLCYDERHASRSPGAYLMQEVLRDLAASGVHTVVSHGAHEYKRRWATAFRPSTRVFLFAPGIRPSAARLLRFGLRPLWRRLGAAEP